MAPNERVLCYVSSYNYVDYIGHTLDSILAQSYQPLDIVVCDNKSTDGSIDLIKEYQKRDPRIILIVHKENFGPAPHGLNNALALEKDRVKYAMLISSDDFMAPRYWESVLPYFSNPAIGFVSIGSICFNEHGDEALRPPRPLCGIGSMFAQNIVACSSPIRMELFHDLGYHDLAVAKFSDWDYWLRATLRGWKGAICGKPLYYSRLHGASVTSNLRTNEPMIIHNKYKGFKEFYGGWGSLKVPEKVELQIFDWNPMEYIDKIYIENMEVTWKEAQTRE